MVDPIEIRLTGTDDSGGAIDSAAKGIKSLGDSAKDAARPLDAASKGLDDTARSASKAEGDIKSVGQASDAAGNGLRDLTADAKGADQALDRMGGSTSRTNKFVGEGGRAFGEYGTGIGGVGDRMDELDTRAMGLADGFAGLTDAAKWNKLTLQEQAMVASDMGSSMYNFVVPSLQSVGKTASGLKDKFQAGGMKAFTADLGGVGKAAIGAGAALGVAGIALAIKEIGDARKEASLDKIIESFLETGEAAKVMVDEMDDVGLAGDRARAAFDKMVEQSPKLAQAWLDQAVAMGLNEETAAALQAQIDTKNEALDREAKITGTATDATDENTTATERMTKAMEANADAVRGMNDAVRAATDPLFGMLDAMNQQRDSQASVNEAVLAYHDAVNKHGEGSSEAAEALRTLNDAQDDAVMSAADLESAESTLTAQIKEHPASLANARNALERWRQQGSITEGQARRMATRFENAADEANRIQGTRTATLRANDNASGKVISVGNRLRELDGQSATVNLNAVLNSAARNFSSYLGFAGGGRVPEYLAAGGLGGGMHPGGPRGTDTVPAWLTPGEAVFNKPQQREILNMLGGGAMGAAAAPTLVYQGDGSPLDRALFDYFRERIRFEHGGNVQRGLGWN